MDLDYLHRRQIEERQRAEEASCAEAREAHLAIAGIFGRRIESAGGTLADDAGHGPDSARPAA